MTSATRSEENNIISLQDVKCIVPTAGTFDVHVAWDKIRFKHHDTLDKNFEIATEAVNTVITSTEGQFVHVSVPVNTCEDGELSLVYLRFLKDEMGKCKHNISSYDLRTIYDMTPEDFDDLPKYQLFHNMLLMYRKTVLRMFEPDFAIHGVKVSTKYCPSSCSSVQDHQFNYFGVAPTSTNEEGFLIPFNGGLSFTTVNTSMYLPFEHIDGGFLITRETGDPLLVDLIMYITSDNKHKIVFRFPRSEYKGLKWFLEQLVNHTDPDADPSLLGIDDAPPRVLRSRNDDSSPNNNIHDEPISPHTVTVEDSPSNTIAIDSKSMKPSENINTPLIPAVNANQGDDESVEIEGHPADLTANSQLDNDSVQDVDPMKLAANRITQCMKQEFRKKNETDGDGNGSAVVDDSAGKTGAMEHSGDDPCSPGYILHNPLEDVIAFVQQGVDQSAQFPLKNFDQRNVKVLCKSYQHMLNDIIFVITFRTELKAFSDELKRLETETDDFEGRSPVASSSGAFHSPQRTPSTIAVQSALPRDVQNARASSSVTKVVNPIVVEGEEKKSNEEGTNEQENEAITQKNAKILTPLHDAYVKKRPADQPPTWDDLEAEEQKLMLQLSATLVHAGLSDDSPVVLHSVKQFVDDKHMQQKEEMLARKNVKAFQAIYDSLVIKRPAGQPPTWEQLEDDEQKLLCQFSSTLVHKGHSANSPVVLRSVKEFIDAKFEQPMARPKRSSTKKGARQSHK